MYFDTNESKSHKEAKGKLFDLIVSRRVEILDQHGNSYEIFTGKHDKEFLHIESFIMDYSDDALFSNPDSPCKKHLESFNTTGHCDTKGYYGAFKELPCEKCVISNFRKYISGSSRYASYRPDVSFGYDGKHKIWLEIKNESPCSENKINFCRENGIVLLEIDANEVLLFKKYNGELVFNKLDEYEEKFNVYEAQSTIENFCEGRISAKGYVDSHELQEFRKMFLDIYKDDVLLKDVVVLAKSIKDKYIYIHGKEKEVINYFKLKGKEYSVYVTKETYDDLVNKEYLPNYYLDINKLIESVVDEVATKGYYSLAKYRAEIKKLLPSFLKGHVKSSALFGDNKLGIVQYHKKHMNKLIRLGINVEAKSSGIIVNKEVASMIN